MNRCEWCSDDPLYQDYHDKEWGVPVRDDEHLFEMLCLEGAQAGLSWITVLKKRKHYQKVYFDFDIEKVANFEDSYHEVLLLDVGIIRNKLKVAAFRTNAQNFLKVQKEFGSFSNYLWAWVNDKPIINSWKSLREIPTQTDLSDRIAKDLKKRGFKFVGSTIIYAYLQAVGVIDDHTVDCFVRKIKV